MSGTNGVEMELKYGEIQQGSAESTESVESVESVDQSELVQLKLNIETSVGSLTIG